MFAQLLRRGIHVWRLTAVCQAYYTIGGFVISLLEGIIRRKFQCAKLPVAGKPTKYARTGMQVYEGPIFITSREVNEARGSFILAAGRVRSKKRKIEK